MIPLTLLQPFAGVFMVLAALAGAGFYGHHKGYASGRAEVQQAWAIERAAQLAAAASASEANRSVEQQRAQAAKEIERNAVLTQAAARVAAGRTVAAADGLRQRAAVVIAACDRPASNPGAAPPGQPASSPIDLLADLQRRLEDAAGQLAAVADQRGAAGDACVDAYDLLTH